MPPDGRTPVLVGAGQVKRRLASPAGASEPVDLMAEAAEAAAEDSGAGRRLLESVQSLQVVEVLSWRYRNPGLLLGQRLGIEPAELVRTTTGGNSPQMLVNQVAAAIAAGDVEAVMIVGAEAMHTRFQARRTRDWLEWTKQPDDTPPPRVVGTEGSGTSELEASRSLVLPTQVYPLFENALRAARRATADDHVAWVSEWWAPYSEVAASNPHAWSPVARTPEEVRCVGPDNRMVGFPYPKLMNANMGVDMAAAVVLCSLDTARRLGVSEDRWVFPLAGADAHDHWWISERPDLCSSPAIRACGRSALSLAGLGIDDVGHFDLYSCFPSAVQVAANELGVGFERGLTVTGGLCFFGGPGNNYVTHSVASMADVLRRDPGSVGLTTGVGWYLTKHSVGLWSTTPPAQGFRSATPQAEVDAAPRREVAAEHEGEVTVETYTVMHERDGSPSQGLAACLLPDGRRTWGTTTDPDTMAWLLETDPIEQPASLSPSGAIARR